MRKKKRLILLLIFGVPVAGVVALLSLTMPLSTDKMEAVADRLQPGGEWTIAQTSVSPPRVVCLGGKCGTLFRVWEVRGAAVLTEEDFAGMIKRAGYVEDKTSCTAGDSDLGEIATTTCDWIGSLEGFHIIITYSRFWDDTSGGDSSLSISIRKEIEDEKNH